MLEEANVMIVDDLPQNALALVAIVECPGIRVITAASGPEALEVMLAQNIALVLLDVQMPGMDGFEVAHLMRGSARTSAVPVIFVTAGVGDTSRVFRSYETGAVDFLVKPLDPVVIRSKVDVFVRLHRQQLELHRRLGELRDALQTNEVLSAVLGHDLRGPLSAIMHSCAAIEATAGAGEQRQAVDRIRRAGSRMARLVDQMLEAARIRSGQFLVRPRPADLRLVCEEVIAEFALRERTDAIAFTVTGDTSGHWDPDRLAQLLANLLGNAMEHGRSTAPVSVVLDGGKEHGVRMTIANDGTIPEALFGSLFDPFAGAARGQRGLGLGLYIAQQIVRAHGGSIEARSRGGSTIVVLEIPRVPPGNAPAPFAAGAMEDRAGKPPTVLQ